MLLGAVFGSVLTFPISCSDLIANLGLSWMWFDSVASFCCPVCNSSSSSSITVWESHSLTALSAKSFAGIADLQFSSSLENLKDSSLEKRLITSLFCQSQSYTVELFSEFCFNWMRTWSCSMFFKPTSYACIFSTLDVTELSPTSLWRDLDFKFVFIF